MSMGATPAATAEAALDAGRKEYASRRYKSALEQFTRVRYNGTLETTGETRQSLNGTMSNTSVVL